jgi:hypothetical protein
MWWWRKVRRAQIDDKLREAFDRLGHYAVAASIAENYPPAPGEGRALGLTNQQIKQAAIAWMTEHIDVAERHEQRIETVEWAVLIFVAVGVVLDVMRFCLGR